MCIDHDRVRTRDPLMSNDNIRPARDNNPRRHVKYHCIDNHNETKVANIVYTQYGFIRNTFIRNAS